MSSRSLKLSLPLLLALAAAPAAAAPPSRLAAAVDARATARLSGSLRPLAQDRYDRGRLDADTVLSGASIDLRLSPAQEAGLDELLRQQQDPLSPNYHAWLTPQQYGERFGLAAPDLAKIEAWLRGQGLSVDGVDSGGNHIRFSGSVARLESAFQTELHRYRVGNEDHFANATELSVPAALSGMVTGVNGLDDFRPKPRLRQVPAFTSNLSGSTFLSPGDVATIYNITPLYGAGITGSGRKIAVVGQSGINLSDVQKFRAAAGLPPRDPQLVQVPGSSPTTTNGSDDMTESDIDVEWTGGVARDATIVFVYSADVRESIKWAISQNLAPVISISYGNCETASGQDQVISEGETSFKQANMQGQTILASSGDAGAADCDAAGSASASGGLAVDYPASSPEVTGVGGTTFDEGGNTGAYWSGGKNSGSDMVSSAKSYIPEVAWNDTGMATGSSGTIGLSASGGGRSVKFTTKPVWQTGPGVPADGVRDVPDVAVAADPQHDGYLFCTTDSSGHGTCVNGFRDNNAQTTLTVAGGTSFSSPVFAGILTLVADKAGQSGLGNANQRLYQLAAAVPSPFHDIVSGSNRVPTSSGTTIGYFAGSGYDQVTGLGSVDVTSLADAWGSGSGSSSSSGGSGSSSSSSGGSGSSSSSSSGGSSSGSGGGKGGGGAWAPLPLLLLGALRFIGRRRLR
jgi:subtilase family serine protease